MHIVIPMSGIGKRFIDAGYTVPKPLILVEGKPIISHVIDMFPGENKFTFICNKEHLKNTQMRSVLEALVPGSNIISIEPHKLGPVYAVLQAEQYIEEDEEVIVNYCDFGKDWDYKEFLRDMHEHSADGGISAYRGFHPHMLGKINYAFMRENDNWLLEIQEKKPFTENRMNEYASDGTYYFKSGRICKKYFHETIEKKIDLNGEYYVSVVYNLLVQDSLRVRIFEINHMLQWGTPGELEEYEYYSRMFKNIEKDKENRRIKYDDLINVIPMAGAGSRFTKEGYTTPKPLLKINNKPMVVEAALSLPPSEKTLFICQKEHLQSFQLDKEINKYYSNSIFKTVDGLTEGQACTVWEGLKDEDFSKPVLISASDNGMIYDSESLFDLIRNQNIDVLVFTFSGNPLASLRPEMYGWVSHKNEVVDFVSVKKPISNAPQKDEAIVGAFYFKSIKIFETVYNKMLNLNQRINNEFYIDTMIGIASEMKFLVKIFKIDQYICWGTPDDYRTYNYWQTFFNKSQWHPYKL